MMFGRHSARGGAAVRRPARPRPDQAQGRGDLLDPGRPGGRGRRRPDRPRRAGRRRHRRPHLPAQADRRAHACRGAGAGEQRAGLRRLDRPSRRGGALQGPCHRGDGRRAHAGGAVARPRPRPRPRSALLAGCRPRAPLCRQHRRRAGRSRSRERRALSRARAVLRPAARRRSTTGSRREIAKVPAAQRKAITGHDFVPLLRAGLWRAVPGAARLQHRQRAVGQGRGGADPPGARTEDQGAVRREHDQPRPGRPDRPRIRAPWSARASTAMRCRRPAARRRPTRR